MNDVIVAFVQVKLMQSREAAADTEFSTITMDEDVEASLKEAAVISMGTEISAEDMANIVELCDQVRPPVFSPDQLLLRARGLKQIANWPFAEPCSLVTGGCKALNWGNSHALAGSPGIGRRPCTRPRMRCPHAPHINFPLVHSACSFCYRRRLKLFQHRHDARLSFRAMREQA